MEKEFDKILPAKVPNQSSSLCDANLKPGETLVMGGFKDARGNYEFTAIQVESGEKEGASPAYLVRPTIMTLSGQNCGKLGLEPLFSPAKMRIQKSVILPPGGASWTDAASIMTAPMVMTDADTRSTINLGSDKQASVTSFMISPGDDGQSVRIRVRTESTADEEETGEKGVGVEWEALKEQ